MLKALKKDEAARFGETQGTAFELDLDEDDIELVVQQVWGGRCALSGKRFGGHNPLLLTRWDPSSPPAIDNLVLLAQSEAATLLNSGREGFSPEQIEAVDFRLEWVHTTFAAEKQVPAALCVFDLEASKQSLLRRFLRAEVRSTQLVDAALLATTAAVTTLLFQRWLIGSYHHRF